MGHAGAALASMERVTRIPITDSGPLPGLDSNRRFLRRLSLLRLRRSNRSSRSVLCCRCLRYCCSLT